MSQVTYFPRYSQPENIATNNTLLLLRRLHTVSGDAFKALMESLGAKLRAPIGLQFQQQKGTGSSVADGWIGQEPLRIVIETKMPGVKFRVDQLRNHAKELRAHAEALREIEAKEELLLLLSPAPPSSSEMKEILDEIPDVPLLHVTFTAIIENSRECFERHGVTIQNEIDEYEQFCEEMRLLPADEFRMLVVPCTDSYEENMDYRLYYHPAVRNFRAARYFGVYRGKVVQAIGREVKRVVCEVDAESGAVKPLDFSGEGQPQTLSEGECKRIIGAVKDAKRKRGWDLTKGHRWFLCDEWEKTEFKKESPGGVRGRRYLDLRKIVGEPIPDLKTLAGQLREKTFE